MEHAEARNLLGAYALGSLDAGEARALAAHLAACPECRAELARQREVADLLPDALAEVSPFRVHPELERKVLVRRPAFGRRPVRVALWRIAATASLLLAVASTTWAILLAQELRRWQAGIGTGVVSGQQGPIDPAQQRQALDLLDSPTTVRQALLPVDPAPRYRESFGTLWTSADRQDVLAMVDHLPPVPTGRHYELIMVAAGGRRIDVGPLAVDHSGFAMLLFRADRPGPVYDDCMVTLDGVPVLRDAPHR